MAKTRKRRREDDALIASRGPANTPGTMKAGEFFAFGSDPRTGAVGRVLKGQLASKSAKTLGGMTLKQRAAEPGARIPQFDPAATRAARGDLRRGIPVGRVPAPRGPQPAAAADGQPAAPASPLTAETRAPRPSLASFPGLQGVQKKRQANPQKVRLFQRGGGTDRERIAYGFAPKGKGSAAARAWTALQEEMGAYREAVKAAEESDVGFAREIAEEGKRQEAMRERQEAVEGTKVEGRKEVLGIKGEQEKAQIDAKFANRIAELEKRQEFAGLDREDRQEHALEVVAQEITARMEQATTLQEMRDAQSELNRINDRRLEILRGRPTIKRREIEKKDGEPVAEVTTTERGAEPAAETEPVSEATAKFDDDGDGFLNVDEVANRERYNKTVRALKRGGLEPADEAELKAFVAQFDQAVKNRISGRGR